MSERKSKSKWGMRGILVPGKDILDPAKRDAAIDYMLDYLGIPEDKPGPKRQRRRRVKDVNFILVNPQLQKED